MNLMDAPCDSCTVLFVNFNQDCTSIVIGLKNGFKLYCLSQVEELELIHEDKVMDDVRIVERLFSSSLVAFVTSSAPRKLKVCHYKKGSEICNYSYSNTILAVKLNRARLVVCLEETLYIHNIKDMKVLHTIKDTPSNKNGLCVLSVSNDNSFLAYPGSSTIGEVQIFDAFNLQAKSMIPAHDNRLAAMAFDHSGTKLATASEKGTVIRVFNVSDGAKLYEFRRGVKRCATIYSLSFSDDSTFLSASSNTETVHIFKLDDSKDAKPSEEPQSWIGYIGQALVSSASYLPYQVADMFSQGRSFATAHLPVYGMKNICALVTIQKIPRVVVVSSDGIMYIYNIDTLEGGDCSLIKTHRIFYTDDSDSKASSDTGNADSAANANAEQTDDKTAAQSDDTSEKKEDDDPPSVLICEGLSELKINDESEFPPMARKNEVHSKEA